MKIYDISQEVLNCVVYPDDPQPKITFLKETSKGDLYNLSTFEMCSHNGTHIDAPLHFLNGGKTIGDIALEKCVGKAFVISDERISTVEQTKTTLKKLQKVDSEAAKRILVKGKCDITKEIAKVLSDEKIDLIGSETQSVGPEDAPIAVHLELLKDDVVLLEGIRLNEVEEGIYFLNAAPLNIGIAEGAPCRAILIGDE